MADDIRVNGNQFDWASIALKLLEERYFGVTAISYGDARERTKAWGMGRSRRPRGRTSGKYVPEPVTITMWKGSSQTFLRALADAGDGVSFGNTVFQIVVQYVEPDETPITVEIEDCVVTKVTASEEEGSDPLKVELEIDTMAVRRNGLTLFDARD